MPKTKNHIERFLTLQTKLKSFSFLLLGNFCFKKKQKIALNICCNFYCERLIKPFGCFTCKNCKSIRNHQFPKVCYLEPSLNQDISLDQVRNLTDLSNQISWIIPNAHLLNTQIENALLKKLEEPFQNQLFILISPSSHLLNPTIVSRCINFFFNEKDQIAQSYSLSIPKLNSHKIQLVNNLSKTNLNLTETIHLWFKNADSKHKTQLALATKNNQSKISATSIIEILLFHHCHF